MPESDLFYPIVGTTWVFYPWDPATSDPEDPSVGGGLTTLNAGTLQPIFLDNGATVTYWVEDDTGTALAGDTWPQTAAYVSGSQGKFEVVLRHTVALVPHQPCTLMIEVDAGTEAFARYELRLFPLRPGERPEDVHPS